MCVEMQPMGRTWKVTAARCVPSVQQGIKHPGDELQMGIALSAGI